MNMIGTIFMGSLTACGGGAIRDLLVNEIPMVIQSDFYATASILGGIFFFVLFSFNIEQDWILLSTTIFVFVLRLIAIRYKIELPKSKPMRHSPSRLMNIQKAINKRKKD